MSHPYTHIPISLLLVIVPGQVLVIFEYKSRKPKRHGGKKEGREGEREASERRYRIGIVDISV
jgi:hypothetical protein